MYHPDLINTRTKRHSSLSLSIYLRNSLTPLHMLTLYLTHRVNRRSRPHSLHSLAVCVCNLENLRKVWRCLSNVFTANFNAILFLPFLRYHADATCFPQPRPPWHTCHTLSFLANTLFNFGFYTTTLFFLFFSWEINFSSAAFCYL